MAEANKENVSLDEIKAMLTELKPVPADPVISLKKDEESEEEEQYRFSGMSQEQQVLTRKLEIVNNKIGEKSLELEVWQLAQNAYSGALKQSLEAPAEKATEVTKDNGNSGGNAN